MKELVEASVEKVKEEESQDPEITETEEEEVESVENGNEQELVLRASVDSVENGNEQELVLRASAADSAIDDDNDKVVSPGGGVILSG